MTTRPPERRAADYPGPHVARLARLVAAGGSTRRHARHGPPVVLVVDSGGMQRDGHRFYRSANGVWLTDHVPPAYVDEVE